MNPALAALILSTAAAVSSPTVSVRWPEEGAKLPFLRRSFTFGSVAAGSTVSVNGVPLATTPDGAFFGVVDFSTGAFALVFEAYGAGGATGTVRTVSVDGPAAPGGLFALEPAFDLELRPGDDLIARARGPAGLSGEFKVHGLSKRLAMVETWPGLYEGHYRIGAGDDGRRRKVSFRFQGGKASLSAEAPGRVSVADSVRVALTSAPVTVLKSGALGYSLFLPPGIPLEVVGRLGPQLKVSLSESEEGLIDADRVALLPEGAPPPRGRVGRYLHTEAGSDSVRLSVEVERPLPFEVRQTLDPLAFEVRLFGGMHRMDRIRYAPDDPVISDVGWRQESARVTTLSVRTRLSAGWGYDAYYRNGRFILEIRRPPLMRDGPVLRGRRIAVDPGHAPDRGAIGPRGSEEQHLNLALALDLAEMLRSEGATVYMTRTSTEGPPLGERPGLAAKAGAEILVSVHNNAISATDDPYGAPRGFMTFYHQPHGKSLAEAVHEAYRRRSPLPDEGLRWGDLAVCRDPRLPAILTESAYVIFPGQEAMLLDSEQRKVFARAIADGVRAFYEDYRELQRRRPAERRAARP